MKSHALLVLVALVAGVSLGAATPVAIQKPRADDAPLAPDGKRGFGMDLTQKELTELLRSKDEVDRAFFEELTQLTTAARIQLVNARQLYDARGYFQFLPGSTGDDLAALHLAYAKACGAPAQELAKGDARAKALAAMLVDIRFNVRRELLLRAQTAVDDLERSRAVFSATKTGYVSLTPAEVSHIAARADLAAAELRALRSDLEALTPSKTEVKASEEDIALAKQLLEIARTPDPYKNATKILNLLEPRHALQLKMSDLLNSALVDAKLAPLREWRERVLLAAAEVRTRVLEMVPDTKEGDKPRDEIARMKKTERMNQAYGLALEGLGSDPLDPELAWAAGHARQLAWPGIEAVVYFDRFLALVGLRTSDANPGNGRKLSPREQEAYTAVSTFKR